MTVFDKFSRQKYHKKQNKSLQTIIIITYTHGICEFLYELPNDLRHTNLEN